MPGHLNGRPAEPRLLLALGDDGVELGRHEVTEGVEVDVRSTTPAPMAQPGEGPTQRVRDAAPCVAVGLRAENTKPGPESTFGRPRNHVANALLMVPSGLIRALKVPSSTSIVRDSSPLSSEI